MFSINIKYAIAGIVIRDNVIIYIEKNLWINKFVINKNNASIKIIVSIIHMRYVDE